MTEIASTESGFPMPGESIWYASRPTLARTEVEYTKHAHFNRRKH
jgi:hypothetical protein